MCSALLTLLFVLITSVTSDVIDVGLLSEDARVSISACRAHCVTEYADQQPSSDRWCLRGMTCSTCWNTCAYIYTDGWNFHCASQDPHFTCTEGCGSACSFSLYVPKRTSKEDWRFPDVPLVTPVGPQELNIGWTRPERHPAATDTTIVYTLLWKDRKVPRWQHVCTTSELWCEVTGRHRDYPGLAFRLLAVTQEGLAAAAFIRYRRLQQDSPGSAVTSPPTRPPFEHHNISVDLECTGHRPLAVVTWPSTVIKEGDTDYYSLSWKRLGCYGAGVKSCPFPSQEFWAAVSSSDDQAVKYTISELAFNSNYLVTILPPDGIQRRMRFSTDECRTVDDALTLCCDGDDMGVLALTGDIEKGATTVAFSDVGLLIAIAVCLVLAGIIIVMATACWRRHRNKRNNTIRSESSFNSSRRPSVRGSVKDSKYGSVLWESQQVRVYESCKAPSTVRLPAPPPVRTPLLTYNTHAGPAYSALHPVVAQLRQEKVYGGYTFPIQTRNGLPPIVKPQTRPGPHATCTAGRDPMQPNGPTSRMVPIYSGYAYPADLQKMAAFNVFTAQAEVHASDDTASSCCSHCAYVITPGLDSDNPFPN